ncbi:MAG: hypothetical protein DI598_14675 [Pseudopedobacter saltans]|uniref:Cyclic nucleotide-binding protein n=1 Tax=Pseudopedobacter saltans TaxID=151895 RepID=A0A2W5GF64_9SPHI|nr:MAG: hypothetical protein DI598_14675 [Pseudopedobacter saltans]
METFISDLSGKKFTISEQINLESVRDILLKNIMKEHPKLNESNSISLSELNQIKLKYLSQHLSDELGDLNDLEKTVLDSINTSSTLTAQIDDDEKPLKFGEKIADRVADFGGSWKFIISFCLILVFWIVLNGILMEKRAFDPYPFILLNLILSCLAALQAPIIMMSQNRQENKDRHRARNDYMINLKSELEIRMLHEKLDQLIMRYQQDIITLQREQVEQMKKMFDIFKTH